jgi:hypothetical protein
MCTHDKNCSCEETWGYRLMLGSTHEGLSIREVIYDRKGRIVGWHPRPLGECVSSVAAVKRQLVEDMRDLDAMLEATDKPILDEAELKLTMRRGRS